MAKTIIIAIILLILAACSGGSEPEVVATGAPSPEVAAGQKVFERHCGACHSTIEDLVVVGPSLAGIAGTAGTRMEGQDAETYLYQSVLSPEEYLVDGFDNLMPRITWQAAHR